MRPVDSHTAERFETEASSLCTCWRIIRRDGVETGLTDHDQDIVFTGTTFRASAGADGSALEATSGLATDNAEIVGILDPQAFGEDALEAGLFDGAEIQVWRVDWADPAARLLLRTGTLGEVSRRGAQYRAEFRSLKDKLDQETGRLYGRTCDAVFGDARCGIDLSDPAFRRDGTVVSASVRDLIIDIGDDIPASHLSGGMAEVLDGVLGGAVAAIRDHGAGEGGEAVSLWEALPQAPVHGTAVRLTAGCNKRFATCRDRFANQLNFRGFPHIPGHDVLTVVARPGDGA